MAALTVSFKVWHPKLRADEIANQLRLDAQHVFNVGEQRKTPSGRDLEGVHATSFVCVKLFQGDQALLSEEISSWVGQLGRNAEYLQMIVSSGGELVLHLVLLVENMVDFYIDNDLIVRLAAIGIGLSFSLYEQTR